MREVIDMGLLVVLSLLSGASHAFAEGTLPAVVVHSTITTAQHLDDRLRWFSQDSGEELAHLEYDPWLYKIWWLCRQHDMPCGIEESPDDPIHQISDSSRYSEKLSMVGVSSTSTVRYFLDIILSKHPAYMWEVQGGVLVVVPKQGHEYRKWGKPILGKSFWRFNVDNMRADRVLVKACEDAGFPMEDLFGDRLNFFTLFQFLKTLASGIPPVAPPSLPDTRPITLHLKHVTVRQVLNAAVKADGQAIWKFSYDPKNKVFSIRVDSWGRIGTFAIPW